MRTLPVMLVGLAFALAGCGGSGSEQSAGTSTAETSARRAVSPMTTKERAAKLRRLKGMFEAGYRRQTDPWEGRRHPSGFCNIAGGLSGPPPSVCLVGLWSDYWTMAGVWDRCVYYYLFDGRSLPLGLGEGSGYDYLFCVFRKYGDDTAQPYGPPLGRHAERGA